MLEFYNTLTRKQEAFVPIREGQVRMYTCGPTVYNYAHIGNYRAYVFEDLLRRFLKYKGYDVVQVMNITDVDDKIIKGATDEQVALREFTRPYKQAFFDDLNTLRIAAAEHYPEATGHIDAMVDLVRKLVDKGYGYQAEDQSIYYSVDKFQEYGKLANLDPDQMRRAKRVADDDYDKESLRDFVLWKAWKPTDGDIYWETELGKGRPGWHIECSTMSMKYLGEHFDIHTGGVDNIFPHHENEIAQSEAATGTHFVNYWLHCEHLIVEGQKMSKSLGNFYTLPDILARGYPPEVIRFALLGTHYRQKLNFTWEKLAEAGAAIDRLRSVVRRLEQVAGEAPAATPDLLSRTDEQFEAALDDDLNIAEALGVVFSLVKELNTRLDHQDLAPVFARAALAHLRQYDDMLAVLEPSDGGQEAVPEAIRRLVAEREQARAARDFETADRLRDKIQAAGYDIEDTPAGSILKRN